MDRVSRQLAEHAASVRFEDLSPRAVESAKRATLDTVAATIAGSGEAAVRPAMDLAEAWGGKPEARVLAFGTQLPAPLAAWCNAIMARVLEIDDCTDFRPIHPSASAVPALLAIAGANGGVSGRDFIAALAVGQDIIIRLGLAVRVDAMESGRYNLFKVFGPTAAVARALGLEPEQTHNALGLAYAFACGEGQSAAEGAFSLPLQQGIVAQAAVTAALLAQKGSTGSKDFLFGRAGFFNAFEPDPDVDPLGDRLGDYFYGEEISIKPYSACRCCHEGIELAQRSYKKAGGSVPVRRARLTVAPNIKDFVGAHIEEATDSSSPTAAQFSLTFTVAAALTRGDFFLKELQPEVISDPDIRALAHRIEVVADPAFSTDFVVGRSSLEIETETGETFESEAELPLGNPSRSMDFDACVDKLEKCADFSINPPSKEAIERFAARVAELESLDDVSVLVEEF